MRGQVEVFFKLSAKLEESKFRNGQYMNRLSTRSNQAQQKTRQIYILDNLNLTNEYISPIPLPPTCRRPARIIQLDTSNTSFIHAIDRQLQGR